MGLGQSSADKTSNQDTDDEQLSEGLHVDEGIENFNTKV
jgi:hypothetical protein